MEYGVAGISFRVLSLVQRPSDSTNCLGGVTLSQSRWSKAGNAVFHGSSTKKMSRRVFTVAPSSTFSCTAGDTVPLPGTHRVSKTTSGDPFEMQKTFGPAKGKIVFLGKDCFENMSLHIWSALLKAWPQNFLIFTHQSLRHLRPHGWHFCDNAC